MSSRVTLNLSQINKLMTSPAVQRIVDDEGERMAAEAGDGFEYVARPHPFTARGYVQTDSASAARKQARDAVLERVASRRG